MDLQQPRDLFDRRLISRVRRKSKRTVLCPDAVVPLYDMTFGRDRDRDCCCDTFAFALTLAWI
jgi:hypothetical protein